jgi:hypothetical protein
VFNRSRRCFFRNSLRAPCGCSYPPSRPFKYCHRRQSYYSLPFPPFLVPLLLKAFEPDPITPNRSALDPKLPVAFPSTPPHACIRGQNLPSLGSPCPIQPPTQNLAKLKIRLMAQNCRLITSPDKLTPTASRRAEVIFKLVTRVSSGADPLEFFPAQCGFRCPDTEEIRSSPAQFHDAQDVSILALVG